AGRRGSTTMDDTPPIDPPTPADDAAPPTAPGGVAAGADPYGTGVGPGSAEPIHCYGTRVGEPSPDFATPTDDPAIGPRLGSRGRCTRRTGGGSSIATSSRGMYSSTPTARPRSPTSAWPRSWGPTVG